MKKGTLTLLIFGFVMLLLFGMVIYVVVDIAAVEEKCSKLKGCEEHKCLMDNYPDRGMQDNEALKYIACIQGG